eukprot:scaffold88388_cov29-Tisochrysis_lutea.AAC.4
MRVPGRPFGSRFSCVSAPRRASGAGCVLRARIMSAGESTSRTASAVRICVFNGLRRGLLQYHL